LEKGGPRKPGKLKWGEGKGGKHTSGVLKVLLQKGGKEPNIQSPSGGGERVMIKVGVHWGNAKHRAKDMITKEEGTNKKK